MTDKDCSLSVIAFNATDEAFISGYKGSGFS